MTAGHVVSRSSLVILAALAAGCARTSESSVDHRPIRSDQVTDFGILYGRHCAGCHGADGQFGPAPPLNDPLFLAIVPDAVLLRMVAEGRPGTPMPGFSRKKGGSLTDQQVQAVATGIKSHWKPEPPATSPPSYLAPANAGDADAGRGRQIFQRACAPCHGKDGLGGKEMVGPINDPAFLALISDQAVRRYIITGRRDLRMPHFAGKAGRPANFQALSAADVADLVQFVSGMRAPHDSRRTP